MNKRLTPTLMSHTHPTPPSSSNFPLIFKNALKAYERLTKKEHPLHGTLQACDSPSRILVVFQLQVQMYNEYRGVPAPFDLMAFFFFSAFRKVRLDLDALLDISKLIEDFLRRLEIYSELSLNQELVDTIMATMVEVLCILAIVKKETCHDRIKKRLNKLRGKSNIEDSLMELSKLTREEARMASTQAVKVTHTFDDRVRRVTDKVIAIDDTVAGVDYREADVDDRLGRVTNNVLGVDDRVASVNDGVAGVDDGVDDRVAGIDDGVEAPRRRKRDRWPLIAVYLRFISRVLNPCA